MEEAGVLSRSLGCTRGGWRRGGSGWEGGVWELRWGWVSWCGTSFERSAASGASRSVHELRWSWVAP